MLQAARDLGYHTDPVLAALAAHRWHRRPVTAGAPLAVLFDTLPAQRQNIIDRAINYGYRPEVFHQHEYATISKARRLSDVLYHRGVMGIIVGPINTPDFCIGFNWSRFVAVGFSEGAVRPPIHLVMPNHFQAVQQAWDWAWARGFRRIGLAIFDQFNAIDTRDRHAAFLERQQHISAAQRVPLLAVPPWVADDVVPNTRVFRRSEAVQQMREWMLKEHPDVVLGFNDAFRWLLHDAGWKAPRWRAFISLSLESANSRATGLRIPAGELERRAVDWIDSLLRAGERGQARNPSTMTVNFEWQDGSHPPKPRPAAAIPCRRSANRPPVKSPRPTNG